MSRSLDIAQGVSLPFEYVTKTAAILAQRRKGKTYTAAVIAEELYDARLPWVALDPTGAWWGLRSSADGLHEGLPVVVLGGQHADLPLERSAGGLVADLVLDHPGWYVLDLSLFESRAAEREFAIAFATRLHRRKMQPGMDFPLHLFVDEADLFVPQEKELKADTQVLGAFQAIVRRGGLHGLGTTLISQRPALVNKSVLTQLDLLVLLRLVAGNDQDAVFKNYLSRATDKQTAQMIMGSLASLPVGEGWFFEPGEDLVVRAKVRERRTFNSSATPKPGQKRVEPKVFAQLDLVALEEQMRSSIERAREDDPAELRKRIRELEDGYKRAEAAAAGLAAELEARGPAETVVEQVEVEVPVLEPEDVEALAELVEEVKQGQAHIAQAYDGLRAFMDPLAANVIEVSKSLARVESRGLRYPMPTAAESREEIPLPEIPLPPPRDLTAQARETFKTNGNPLAASNQKILDALAWYRAFDIDTPTKEQVGFVSGYKAKGGRFGNLLGELRRDGYIEYPRPGEIALTQKGLAAARDPGLPRTREALHGAVLTQLPASEGKVLRVLLEVYPDSVSRDELGEATGYEPRGGRFGNILGRLSSLGLTHYPQQGLVAAREVLFP